ncbi:MAG: Bax inhibitor-1/YccA family protein [Phycisphaerales bacterium]|nr:Bax inhibitor-1/YccA family protein [Phycisphaerales bacterium]
MLGSTNPTLRNDAFQPAQTWDDLNQRGSLGSAGPAAGVPSISPVNVMTMQGVVNKSAFLLALCVACAIGAWNLGLSSGGWLMGLTFGGLLGGCILGLICGFFPRSAPVTAPLFAIAEGAFVGGISAVYAMRFAHKGGEAGAVGLNTGLILNAAVITFCIFGGLLVGYATRIIRPGPMFNRIVATAGIGILLYSLVAIAAALFGSRTLISVYNPANGGLVSIGFSVLLVGFASMSLVTDFDLVDNGVKNRAPKHMEWYGGFALLNTLVFLYVEVLRLLAKLQSRD